VFWDWINFLGLALPFVSQIPWPVKAKTAGTTEGRAGWFLFLRMMIRQIQRMIFPSGGKQFSLSLEERAGVRTVV
jgi:hypothetical protein